MARLTFPDQQQDLQNAAEHSVASECDGDVKGGRSLWSQPSESRLWGDFAAGRGSGHCQEFVTAQSLCDHPAGAANRPVSEARISSQSPCRSTSCISSLNRTGTDHFARPWECCAEVQLRGRSHRFAHAL
jgi:hypothetical protein